MRNTIKLELEQHVNDLINDEVLTPENREDWHFHAFNEDYYIIGYYQASEWLKLHGVGELEGACLCQEYERENFGSDSVGVYDNTEKVVNMLAYIYGEEIINNWEA